MKSDNVIELSFLFPFEVEYLHTFSLNKDEAAKSNWPTFNWEVMGSSDIDVNLGVY